MSETPRSGRFDLSGGLLCLDFANSAGFRPEPANDRLRDAGSLLDFARQSGLLQLEERELPIENALFAEAIRLRELSFRVFLALARKVSPATVEISRFEAALREARAALRLRRAKSGCFEWEWEADHADARRRILWPILRSAEQLLCSGDLALLRECAAEDCNWLFLDRSRGLRRRWCSMDSCGNREKARRHYQRQKRRLRRVDGPQGA